MRTAARFIWMNLLVLSMVMIGNSGCSRPITVETVPQGSSRANCGGYEWLVKFTLDKNSKAGGWIVQQIDYFRVYDNCDGATGLAQEAHFWEAWRVLPGQNHPANREGFNRIWDDQYVISDAQNSNGYSRGWGSLRFFEGATLPNSMFQNNPRTLAGTLHSDTEPPPFWNTVSDDDTSPHTAFYGWNCCGSGHRDWRFNPDFARLISPERHPKTEPKQTAMKTESSPQRFAIEGEQIDKFRHEFILSSGRIVPASLELQSEAQQTEVVKLTEMIPPWTEDYGSDQAQELRRVAELVSRFPISEIRQGVDEFIRRHDGEAHSLNSLSKVYLLLRVLFDVPSALDIREAKVFGGWVNPSVIDRSRLFNLMWPIGIDQSSGIISVSRFQGYFGAAYDGVGEFDYFRSKFPLRKRTERAPL